MKRYLMSRNKPPTAQKSCGAKYQEIVKKEAFAVHPEYCNGHAQHEFLQGDLYVKIVYIYRNIWDMDVDNIAKRIIDSFKGHFYQDDCCIKHLHCTKVLIDDYTALEINNETKGAIPNVEFRMLNRYLSNGAPTILYFEVGPYSYAQFTIGGDLDGY